MRRNGRWTVAVAACALAALAVPPAAPAQDDQARYRLANGCYAMEAGDRLVAKDGSGGYAATATEGAQAEPLRMQATTLGQYLLYGKEGDFLGTDQGAVATEPSAGPTAEWRVENAPGGRFVLRLASTGEALGVRDGRLVLGGEPTTVGFRAIEGCAT